MSDLIFSVICGVFIGFLIWQLPLALERDEEFSSRHLFGYNNNIGASDGQTGY